MSLQPTVAEGAELLRTQLAPDERLIWTGTPDPHVHFTRLDWYLVPFSVVWLGFVVTMISVTTSAASTTSAPAVLFLGAFFLIGLYQLVGRFFFKAWRKRRTVYGITSRRAISMVGTTPLNEVPTSGVSIVSRETPDGQHLTVVFSTTHYSPLLRIFGRYGAATANANTGMDVFSRSDPSILGFYDVADVAGLRAAIATAS